MNAKISAFVICGETIIYLLLYNLHDCTFKVLQNCKKLKVSRIYIHEDFCQATLRYRKELWKKVKRLREEEDKIAYLQYRSVVVKDKNNVR